MGSYKKAAGVGSKCGAAISTGIIIIESIERIGMGGLALGPAGAILTAGITIGAGVGCVIKNICDLFD